MDSASVARTFRPDVLEGRVALVTGGGSGICQEVAIKLAEYGAKVAVMGRREAALAETVALIKSKGKQAIAVAGDVRSEQDAAAAVRRVVETFGRLDVLVNGAAGNFLALAEQLSTNAFRTALKASGDACIINISATLHLPATWYQVHASAAKAAVDSITRSLALEWGTFGIRVNGVAPGPIADTTGTTKLAGDVDPEQLKEFLKEGIPLGRAGTKCDIAAAVLFLVSPAGSFATGDTMIVDGANYLFKPALMPRDVVSSWSKQMEKKSRKPATGKAKL
ncbi:hypothetical protein ATCC90586_006261 [Pythium insidiosum]|nr:hypothetical protein ATCC90586_006261 [Pythium insidiosum]